MLLRAPKHKIVHVKPQRVKEIRHHKGPVFLKIPKHIRIPFAAVPKVTAHQRIFQTGNQHKAHVQGNQHGINNTYPKNPGKKQRKQHRRSHSYQEKCRYLFIHLADGKIKHGVKNKHQRHISTIP